MITVFLLNCFIVAIAVIFHYEVLSYLSVLIKQMKVKHRFRIVFGVFGCLIAHTMEIWFFAFSYYFISHSEKWGHFEGNFDGSLMDCAYFSFTTYTTLGFGDISPFGDLRYLTGIESLTGLVLITWTASFLFYEMQSHWDSK
jgi:hypothetical protein